MSRCTLHATGVIELYFYDELEAGERRTFERHLPECAECRSAFDELALIRSALAARPAVATPAGGDWAPFMNRLDEAIRFEEQARAAAEPRPFLPSPAPVPRRRVVPYLAMAAAAALVTAAVVYYGVRSNRQIAPQPPQEIVATGAPAALAPTRVSAEPSEPTRSADAAFTSLSEQHFERSKLVVLGLANKDPRLSGQADWEYERGLASNLLRDTRVYRLAAEERGLKGIAGVMGDLELVLLQTSLAERPDQETLQQIQRLIHKRDLVTKMEVATTGS